MVSAVTFADQRTPGLSAANRGLRGKSKPGTHAHTPYGTPAGTPMSTCSQVTFSLMYPQLCSIGMDHFLNARVLGVSVVCFVVCTVQSLEPECLSSQAKACHPTRSMHNIEDPSASCHLHWSLCIVLDTDVPVCSLLFKAATNIESLLELCAADWQETPTVHKKVAKVFAGYSTDTHGHFPSAIYRGACICPHSSPTAPLHPSGSSTI